MTGQQLKNSILQMAVQGKLVPQDPNDEPASVLLERIRAEKEQLIKEGKIKKEKNPSIIFRGADNLPYEKVGKKEPVCIADEVPFEIPESWEWVTLKMIAVTELGKTLDKAKNQGDYKPYLCSINVYWTGIDLSTVKEARFEESELPKYELKKGDLLICEGGDVGRSAIWEEEQEMYYQNALHRVRFYGGINPYYFRLLMECYKGNKIIDEQSKGMTIKHLVQSALNTIYFPLPPIQEQQRIVDKFQSLLPLLDRYNASEIKLSDLNTGFPKLLKKSILQEAVQGKLVPQDPADEPASILLERIRAEKEELIKSGKIKRNKHESVIFRRDNSHYEKCGSKEENIDEIIPFDLPDSWEWIRLSAILTSTDAGKSPQCENRPRNNCEWGVIKTTAIQDGYFLAEENKVLPLSFNIQESMMVHHGDLLITRAGPRNRTGVICVVDGKPENLILSDKTVRLSYLRDFVNPHYVMTALSSPAMQYFVIDAMTGMAASQVNISQEKMKTFLLPLPPLNEQQRIVDEVGKIFAHISKLNF